MKMSVFDYIIIGSGVAGNVCAYLLEKKGYNSIILEKQADRCEKICGGGISHKALYLLQEIGINTSNLRKFDHKDIIGHQIFWKDKTIRKIYKKENVSIGMQRKIFDEFLLKNALRLGAKIKYSECVKNIGVKQGYFNINGYIAKNYIVAIGARGFMRSFLQGQSLGISALITGHSIADDNIFYYWFLNEEGSQYTWLFPIGNNLWNIGIWERNPCSNMKMQLLRWEDEILSSKFPLGYDYVTKPKGDFLGHIDQREEGMLGIGDFAGNCNPQNGGGIIGAIKSAISLVKKS